MRSVDLRVLCSLVEGPSIKVLLEHFYYTGCNNTSIMRSARARQGQLQQNTPPLRNSSCCQCINLVSTRQ